jgi:uncharacterized SAM-binding protein YcdF (DUF218 family)
VPEESGPVFSGPVVSKRVRGLLRRVFLFLLVCLVLATVAYVFRAPLLTALAKAWIVDDPPAKADAIVVLGGGVDYRPFGAARLYNAGYAPKILIMDVDLSPTERMGIKQPEKSVTRQILIHEGVPDSAIETVGRQVHNTYQESMGVKEWANKSGAKRLLITTEIFHTRRVRWLFRKQFRGTGTEIRTVAVQPWDYQSTNWWSREQGLVAFQNEWLKLPYYWFKY